MIQHTPCKTVYYTLYEKKGTLCFQGSPRHFGLRIRLAHFLPSCTKALGVPKEERDH